MLLGWAGADRDKAVLKYAEVLAQRGYASVRSVQPLLTAFSPLASARRRWALALLRYLEEQHLWPQRRLVLFAFSNGEIGRVGERDECGNLKSCTSCVPFERLVAVKHSLLLHRPSAPSRRAVRGGAADADCRERPAVSGTTARRQLPGLMCMQ